MSVVRERRAIVEPLKSQRRLAINGRAADFEPGRFAGELDFRNSYRRRGIVFSAAYRWWIGPRLAEQIGGSDRSSARSNARREIGEPDAIGKQQRVIGEIPVP